MSPEINNANNRITTKEKIIRSAATIAITGAAMFAINKDRESSESDHPNVNPSHELVLNGANTDVVQNGFLPKNEFILKNNQFSLFEYYLTLEKMIAHPVQGPKPLTEEAIGQEFTKNYVKAEEEKEAIEHTRIIKDALIAKEAQIAEDSRIAAINKIKTQSIPSPLQNGPTSAGYEGLGTCGGDLPPCYIKNRESRGNYATVNETGCGGYTCGGAWQFDPRTWNGFGGYPFAQDAPPSVQDAKAREVWDNGNGCSHWAACNGE